MAAPHGPSALRRCCSSRCVARMGPLCPAPPSALENGGMARMGADESPGSVANWDAPLLEVPLATSRQRVIEVGTFPVHLVDSGPVGTCTSIDLVTRLLVDRTCVAVAQTRSGFVLSILAHLQVSGG